MNYLFKIVEGFIINEGAIFSMSQTEYRKQDYWERRFQTEDQFEWLQTWESCGDSVKKLLGNFTNKILIIGSGTSDFGWQIYNSGWENVTNVDFSPTVIENMQVKYENCPKMKWIQQDCREMNELHSQSFDVVLDKSTLDAISCGGASETIKATTEVHRVLKKGGKYLIITYSRFRLEDFIGEENVNRELRHGENNLWSCQECVLLNGPDDNGSLSLPSNFHYLYVVVAK